MNDAIPPLEPGWLRLTRRKSGYILQFIMANLLAVSITVWFPLPGFQPGGRWSFLLSLPLCNLNCVFITFKMGTARSTGALLSDLFYAASKEMWKPRKQIKNVQYHSWKLKPPLFNVCFPEKVSHNALASRTPLKTPGNNSQKSASIRAQWSEFRSI